MKKDTLRYPEIPCPTTATTRIFPRFRVSGYLRVSLLAKMENIHMSTNKHPNTHFYKKVRKSDALDALIPCFDFDNRVTCAACANTTEVEADEFLALEKAQHMQRMGKKIGFEKDTIKQQGKWVKISWVEKQCTIQKIQCLPPELKHRCHYFQPFNEASIQQSTNEWWQL